MLTRFVLAGILGMSALVRPLAGDVKEPMSLCEFVAPRYSMLARTLQMGGSVTVKVKVGADGTITEVWPPRTVIAPSGDIGQAPPAPGANSYFEDGSVAAVKKWRFCPGPAGREIDVMFVYKVTEPGRDGWAPTEVSFHAPAVVEISTARIPPSVMSQTNGVTSDTTIGH